MLGHRWSARTFPFGSVLCIALGAVVSGCATFSPDGGMSAVGAIATPELKADVVKINSDDDAAEAVARVLQLLKSPLSAELLFVSRS